MTTKFKRIEREEFNRLVHVKPFKGKFDAYMTWEGLDFFELANSAEKAKEKLFKRIGKK